MVRKKRGLGKGLSALIPDETLDNNNEIDNDTIYNINLSLIEPNIEQPRKSFNDDAMLELAYSIKKHGVIQPIVVRKHNDGYQIIAGERRWRAAREAGLKQIPCIVKDIQQFESTQLALIENLQREDLNPIEEANAYEQLMNNYNLTQQKLSEIVGKSRSSIANKMRLLSIDERVKNFVLEGKISSAHARTLSVVKEKELQFNIAERIIEKQLSVRETEELVKKLKSKNNNKKKRQINEKDPIIVEIEDLLRKKFGTKVQIDKGRKKGKIQIEYYGQEDLDRILDLLNVQ